MGTLTNFCDWYRQRQCKVSPDPSRIKVQGTTRRRCHGRIEQGDVRPGFAGEPDLNLLWYVHQWFGGKRRKVLLLFACLPTEKEPQIPKNLEIRTATSHIVSRMQRLSTNCRHCRRRIFTCCRPKKLDETLQSTDKKFAISSADGNCRWKSWDSIVSAAEMNQTS